MKQTIAFFATVAAAALLSYATPALTQQAATTGSVPANIAGAIADTNRPQTDKDLDAQRKPAGVIDWGDIHLGDPAPDIAIAHMLLPANAHAAFRDAYGPIDERTWRAAHYRALYHAILEIEYGIRENDAGMRDCGTATLRLADVLNLTYV